MNINSNDILNRLLAGENAQDIANEIADILNSAINAYEERKSAENKAAEKVKDMTDLCAQFNAFLAKYYDFKEEMLSVKEIETMIEGIDTTMKALKALDTLTEKMGEKKKCNCGNDELHSLIKGILN